MTNSVEAIQRHLKSQRGPRYRRIAAAICAAVDAGELAAGAKLPTHRALAEALGVSVQTVSFAYAEAEQEGYVHGLVGSGTYVSHHQAEQQADFLKPELNGSGALIDLSLAGAIEGAAQRSAFAKTLTEMAASPEGLQVINAIKPFAGLPRHREAALPWLRRLGIGVGADQVCLCNGVTHGLLIALGSLVKPGGSVACEALVDHGLIALSRTLNFKLEGVAMDDEGMIPEALEQCCQHKRPEAICLTPNLHNPTTLSQSDPRRQALAAVAERYGVPVVEDDIFGALPSERRTPVSHYLPDSSYYLTGFTKAVASGLRVGYLVPPRSALDAVVGRLRASTWMVSPVVAELVSRWVTDGSAERLVSGQRQALRRRQQRVAEELAGYDYRADPEGPLVWLQLPEAWRAEAFIHQARNQGVSITGAEPFVVGHQAAPHAVRICVSSARSEEELGRGLAILRALLASTPPPTVEAV